MGKRKGKKKPKSASVTRASIRADLEKLGLQVRDIAADGNCLFRSVADQLCNHSERHAHFRALCVQYLRDNPDEFRPFVFDEEYDVYVNRLARQGVWAGNLEIRALSLACQVHIIVHQEHPQPRFCVWHPTIPRTAENTAHLLFVDNEHYASVRLLSDATDTKERRAAPIPIGPFLCRDERQLRQHVEHVMQFVPSCRSVSHVKRLLLECNNDIDDCIETLIEQEVNGDISDWDTDNESDNDPVGQYHNQHHGKRNKRKQKYSRKPERKQAHAPSVSDIEKAASAVAAISI
ncbi:MAG: hypothetical protein MHM6MM_009698 [Cercozoa sp. M6MM]